MKTKRTRRIHVLNLTLALVCMLWPAARAAQAGCGCEKPPPNLASVRPNATYAGTKVALFSPSFVVGQVYSVDFLSGTTSARATVTATVTSRRDLADAKYKPTLSLTVPALPLGPTRINVHLSNLTTNVLVITDDAFTVVPQPVALPQDLGTGTYPNFTAAIGRDGTFYISLDMTAIGLPRLFRAQAKGYPLSFTNDDVTFYNTQGFLMQLLTANMPGLWSITSANSTVDSDLLMYSRHEFDTYYLQHAERQPHQIVNDDWHLDGTRHVDHNHLILAIGGVLPNGVLPVPGATPAFTLVMERYSLFSNGLVGSSSVSMSGTCSTDSPSIDAYMPGSATPQNQGDVFTNGKLSLSNKATVNGNATAATFSVSGNSVITGTTTALTQPMVFMPVKIPVGLPSLGTISLSGTSRQLNGPGSFLVGDLMLKNYAQLNVNNSAGPVTLYVTGQVSLSGGASITVTDPNPEKFAIYVASTKSVTLTGGSTAFNGVVYAPTSTLSLTGSGQFFGSFVAGALQSSGDTKIHYDTALRAP